MGEIYCSVSVWLFTITSFCNSFSISFCRRLDSDSENEVLGILYCFGIDLKSISCPLTVFRIIGSDVDSFSSY